jgi:HlyD family secretion protein
VAAGREAALRTAKISLDNTDIVVPFDGTVLERNIERGRSVKADPKANLFLIAADLAIAQLESNMSEEDIGEVKVGNDVSVTVGSLPSRQFTGRVLQIDPAPRTIDGVAMHRVVVSAFDPDRRLEPGRAATITIVVEQRQDILRVPVRALHYAPSGQVPASEQPKEVPLRLWVLRDKEPKAVSVRLGISDGAHQEVVGGDLQAGDELIVGERGRDITPNGKMAE